MRADGASGEGQPEVRPPLAAVPLGGGILSPVVMGSALALALAVALLIDGGFGDGSRLGFVALAGLALVLASSADPIGAAEAMRSPPIAALAGLAGLTALSALWSPAEPSDVLRWAMVIAGYAATAVVAAVLVRRDRSLVTSVAVVLAVLAAVAGLWGILAAALGDPPGAARIGGSWRPAGPFEYPPALAILQVSVLPALIIWMSRLQSAAAMSAAAGAGVAGVVIALSHSRMAIAALLFVLLAVPLVGRSVATRRRRGAAAALVAVTAVAGYVIAGGLRSGGPQGAGYLLGLLGLVACGATVWPALVRRLPPAAGSGGSLAPSRRGVVAAVGCALLLLGVGALALMPDRQGGGIQPSDGFDHGRADQWNAALEVGESKPFLGAGGESYLLASRDEQGRDPVLYAHSLPLESFAELGVPGFLLAITILGGTVIAFWRARRTLAAALLGAPALAFAAANLVDWSWHLAGSAAVWAVSLGALVGSVELRDR